MLRTLLETISLELSAAKDAWQAILVASIMCIVTSWRISKAFYSSRIATLEERLKWRDDQLASRKETIVTLASAHQNEVPSAPTPAETLSGSAKQDQQVRKVPRSMSANEEKEIRSILGIPTGIRQPSILIEWVQSDAYSDILGRVWATIFRQAGWRVVEAPVIALPEGVHVAATGRRDSLEPRIRAALRFAEIYPAWELDADRERPRIQFGPAVK